MKVERRACLRFPTPTPIVINAIALDARVPFDLALRPSHLPPPFARKALSIKAFAASYRLFPDNPG